MFTADVRFSGFTTEDWTRLLYVFKPRAAEEAKEQERARGTIVAVHDGTRIVKLLSTREGRLPLPDGRPSLKELAEAHGASTAWGIELGALEEVMERFGARIREEHDFTDHLIVLAGALREVMAEIGPAGVPRIETWPRRLAGVPLPTSTVVRRGVDSISRDGEAILMVTFDQGELFTAAILRRKGGAFDYLGGPEEIRPHTGLLSRDWRRDVTHIVRVVEDRVAPLSFGCFAEVETFRSLLVDPTPGAWGRAVAVRDVILSPMPRGAGVALGVDGARYLFREMRGLVRRYDTSGRFRAIGKLGFNRAIDAATDYLGSREGELESQLGFDPLEVVRLLLRR